MDIILDSNVFRSDIPLRSKDFDVVKDYLKKTSSNLVLPQIILDEVIGLYKRNLDEKKQQAAKAASHLNLILLDDRKHIALPAIDAETETNEYRNFLFKRLGIKDRYVLPYDNQLLPVIVQREIDRKKPSGDKGQGFRDTLIWLTMLDYTKTCHEKQIIFISNNTDDFSNSDKQILHDALTLECEVLGIKVNYFRTLKEFIEGHSSKIDFLTLEWVDENLDFKLVEELIEEDLNGKERRTITSHFQRYTTGECTGYNVEYAEVNEVKELFVYEMLNNKLIVNLILEVTVRIEASLRYDDSFDNEYAYYESNENETLHLQATISFEVEEEIIGDIELSEIIF